MKLERKMNSSTDFSYFDEEYFQGGNKGTAYVDYLNSAPNSNTFRQIADCIVDVFKPVRCLEIGCATGAIVNNINKLGVECHGIDVSEWAVKNRLHENVKLSSAHQLDFPDNHFDLVYSVHALEHLPRDIAEPAIREITRVSESDATQFHLLPIIGEIPYTGEIEAMRASLKKDPTHNIIENIDWWRNLWMKNGWKDTGLSFIFDADTDTFELSGCHYVLRSSLDNSQDLTQRVTNWNRHAALKLFNNRPRNVVTAINNQICRTINFPATPIWLDASWDFRTATDLSGSVLRFVIENKSKEIQDFRVALADRSDFKNGYFEDWRRFPPGRSLYTCAIDSMVTKDGNPNIKSILKILIGGTSSNCSVSFDLMAQGLGEVS
jgi:SAM-dependent methyltransferase